MKRMNTASSLAMKVGTPKTRWSATLRSCSLRKVSSGVPVASSANTASASRPCSTKISRSTASSRMSRLSSCRAVKSARCTRWKASGHESRTAMPTCMASRDGAFVASSQTSGWPSSTCAWFSENDT